MGKAHVRTGRLQHVAGGRDGPRGELVAYTINVSELLHALGAREGGVDVHGRVGLLHFGWSSPREEKDLFCSKPVQVQTNPFLAGLLVVCIQTFLNYCAEWAYQVNVADSLDCK